MVTVMITGGAGFIGCELSRRLLDAGYDVTAVDNLHPQVHGEPGLPVRMPTEVQFIPADVTSADNWRSVFKYVRPEVIVHLAAETGTGQSLTQASRHGMVNVVGTTALLDALAAVNHKPARILLSSSRAVYGDGAWAEPGGAIFHPGGRSAEQLARSEWDYVGPSGKLAEALPSRAGQLAPSPVSIYGATKLAQEHILHAWCSAFEVPLTVLRLQNVYGPGQALGNPYTGILALFTRLAREGKPIEVYEDGKIIRDFVHVSDVAECMAKAIQSKGGTGTLTLDVGSGEKTTVLRVAKLIAQRWSAPSPVISGRFRHGDVRAAYCDIQPARAALGYSPGMSLENGLATLKGC